jgi:hypothetical protein
MYGLEMKGQAAESTVGSVEQPPAKSQLETHAIGCSADLPSIKHDGPQVGRSGILSNHANCAPDLRTLQMMNRHRQIMIASYFL